MNDDLDDFLARVDEISQQVKDIKEGKLDVNSEDVDEEDIKFRVEEMLQASTAKRREETPAEFNKRREEALGKHECHAQLIIY